MHDRRDFVTRGKRHQHAEWGRGAARLATGIELERIREQRARMTDAEKSAERERVRREADAREAQQARRAARRAKLQARRENWDA